MKSLLLSLLLSATISQAQNLPNLPIWNENQTQNPPDDWLVKPCLTPAQVFKTADGRDLILFNGLLLRRFRLSPGVACTDFRNLSNGQQLLRALSPEASFRIDGKIYTLGGLAGQTERAYLLPEWLDGFSAQTTDFQLENLRVEPLKPRFDWKPKTWASNKKQPSGTTLIFTFRASAPDISGLRVQVFYELYDGLPLLVKQVLLENTGQKTFEINRITSEILAVVEEESAVGGQSAQLRRQHGLFVETDFTFGTDVLRDDLPSRNVHWLPDSAYTSQVNYAYQTPNLLQVFPEKVGTLPLAPGAVLRSVRAHELLMDSYDRERRGLAQRKMYRTIAPWTSQNPIFMHLVSQNDQQVRTAVEQCAATGYEAVILSFGSHCNMEDTSAANVRRWRELADFAHSKGILLGSYALFSSRRISDADDVIDPKTGRPGGAVFGNAPCFGSPWGIAFRNRIQYFLEKTGFDIWENDGPYPGDVCASTTHPGHRDLGDSQWQQLRMQADLYRWCNEHGVYVNAPDWYFLNGANKIALGYREVNFSLSRDQQKLLNRQNIFDGTWEKTPSMGWGFVPLTHYQGGGPEAVLEPLSEHLGDYEQLMVQYYGAGVQACYRGPCIFDTEATQKMVSRTIAWYKRHRDILNSDIIHLRRADGRDWDGILHVNPALPTKAFLLVFNPLKTPIARKIRVPLYYAGLENEAVFFNDNFEKRVSLNRAFEAELTVDIPAGGWAWFEVR